MNCRVTAGSKVVTSTWAESIDYCCMRNWPGIPGLLDIFKEKVNCGFALVVVVGVVRFLNFKMLTEIL